MPRIRAVPFCTPDPGYHYQYVSLIVHFEDEDVTPSLWEETLLRIGFRHRHVVENLATLDVLKKQWIHLILLYGSPGYEPKFHRNSKSLVNRTTNTIPGCCISAAFGDKDGVEQMPSVPLENFTFDMFFDLFLQIWPREEVVDLFSTYSDGFDQMDHNGLNEFLNRSISKSMLIRPCLESDISTNRLDCPRKIKHINLMQWEARHFYRNQKKDDITRPNKQAPSRTNEGHRSRSEHHHSVARSTRTATTGRTGLMSQSKTSRDQSIGTNQIHVTFQLSVDEFRELVNRYEWNLASRKKNRFSVQGFYRFLLSYHYQTLMRYHTVQDTGPTVGDDKSGLCMMEPITHYHIQSACLISPPVHIFDSKSDTTESVVQIQRRNVLTATRTIRQLLLLGTRALVLDCWFMNQPITHEIDKDVDWFVEPVYSSGKLSPAEWNTSDDLSQEISPMDRLTHSVPLKDVLKAIRSSVFLVSQYPVLLFLRIDTMGSREQNLLAGLLQDSLGEWLLIPPLPKFVAQPNSPYLEKSKYYSQAHQFMPSPEALRKKILLNVSHLRRNSPLNTTVLNNPTLNKQNSQPADEGGGIQVRSCRLPPLTVLVTDPEGEEKVAKPDVGSLSSSTQLSPVTSRRLSITNGKSTRLFHPRTHQFVNSDYRPALHGHRTEFMGSLMCPHPRLARLIALTEPDLLPPLCHMLFTQHHRTTLTGKCRPNPVSDAAKQTPNNSYGVERSEVALGKNDPQSVMVDDFEAILSLSSLTFARTVQLQHRARKQRLLKRLLTEAYGNRTRRGVQRKVPDGDSKLRDSEPDILNKKQGPEGPSKEGIFTTAGRGSIRMRGIRGWFGKRVVSPVSSLAEANTSNRPSLLSSGSENSRRTSVIATPFRTRSPIPDKADHVGVDTSVAGQTRNLFTSFYRRLSILSNGLPSPRTPPSQTSCEPAPESGTKPIFEFRLSQSSTHSQSQQKQQLPNSTSLSSVSYTTSRTNSSSGSSSPIRPNSVSNQNKTLSQNNQIAKPPEGLKSETKRTEEVIDKFSTGGLIHKRNMSFGRCSCSSGSKSHDSSTNSEEADARPSRPGAVEPQLRLGPLQKKSKETQNAYLNAEQIGSTQTSKGRFNRVAQFGKKLSLGISSGSAGSGAGSSCVGEITSPRRRSRDGLSPVHRVNSSKIKKRATTEECEQNDKRQLMKKQVNTASDGQVERTSKPSHASIVPVVAKHSPEQTVSSTSESTETTETSFTSTDSFRLDDNQGNNGGGLPNTRFLRENLRARWSASKRDQSTDSSESDDDDSDKSLEIVGHPSLASRLSQTKPNGSISQSDRKTVGFSDSPTPKLNSPRSTFQSKHVDESSKTNIPRRALWRQANQWLAKCRVVIATLTQMLQILTNRSSVKALAEYGKHRLVLLYPPQQTHNWSMRQILRLTGCQLIPMDIAILLGPMHEAKASMTTDLTFVFQSARQQVTNRFEVEQIMIQSNGPYTGYTLKPALLRCPTSVHIHRYPKEWILKGIPSTVHSSESESEEAARWFARSDRNRWPVQPCVCCYDPFQSQFGGHDQLKRLQREHHVGALRAYQRTEHASLLPWNLSVHIVTLSEMCKHHQQEAQDSAAPVFDSSTINPRPGHKLPRRYQRAASSAAATAAVPATTTAEMVASTVVRMASRSPMLPFRDEPTNRSRVTGSLSTDNVAQGATQTESWPQKTDMTSALVYSRKKWFFMQARLLHPVTRTNMEIDGSIRPTNVFLTEHVRQFETTTTVPPLSKVNIPHAQTAPNIQSLTSVFRDVTIEPRGHDLTTPPFRSCSLLHLSQLDLVHNQLRGSRVEFVRVPLPDCVVLRIEALIPFDRTRTPRLFASHSVSTSCPLRNTLTGYNHLRLQMHEDQSVVVTCHEPQGTRHQWKHRILRQSIGLLLFCKIHMEVYSPSCFGELMDSVQMEYSSRSNSLNRRTIQPSIPGTPYSSSQLFSANLRTGTFDRTPIMDPFWTTDSASDEPPAHDVF